MKLPGMGHPSFGWLDGALRLGGTLREGYGIGGFDRGGWQRCGAGAGGQESVGSIGKLGQDGLLQGDDEGSGGGVAYADVAVDSVGVEVDGVACFDVVGNLSVPDVELTGEQEEELAADVLVGAGFAVALVGEELGEVGVEQAVGDEVTEALEVVGRVGDAGLRQTHALLAAMDTEEGLGFGIEEVAEVFREDHGDAGQVAQRGDDAAGLELREEAGGEAGVAAEIDQAHRLFEAQILDALADALLGYEGFSGFAVDLEIAEVGKGIGMWQRRRGSF